MAAIQKAAIAVASPSFVLGLADMSGSADDLTFEVSIVRISFDDLSMLLMGYETRAPAFLFSEVTHT